MINLAVSSSHHHHYHHSAAPSAISRSSFLTLYLNIAGRPPGSSA